MIEVYPNSRFRLSSNGKIYEIVRIEGTNAVVIEIDSGKKYLYGVEALKRIQATKEE